MLEVWVLTCGHGITHGHQQALTYRRRCLSSIRRRIGAARLADKPVVKNEYPFARLARV